MSAVFDVGRLSAASAGRVVLLMVVMTSSVAWLFRETVSLVMRFFLLADAFSLVRAPPSSLRRRIVAVRSAISAIVFPSGAIVFTSAAVVFTIAALVVAIAAAVFTIAALGNMAAALGSTIAAIGPRRDQDVEATAPAASRFVPLTLVNRETPDLGHNFAEDLWQAVLHARAG
jgi:hypothetical protein